MKLIAHRGNIDGSYPMYENSPEYIDVAISKGYDVEIDLWRKDNSNFLGHDKGIYKVSLSWLLERHDKLWIHCKNLDALWYFNQPDHNLHYNTNYFWHQYDDFTLTSRGFIWTYPSKPLTSNSIVVLPEVDNLDKMDWFSPFINSGCVGVCSDFVERIRDVLENFNYSVDFGCFPNKVPCS